MLGILGVPPVTKRADTPPKVPVEGGVHDLEYRDWRPGIYPQGDTPEDILAGILDIGFLNEVAVAGRAIDLSADIRVGHLTAEKVEAGAITELLDGLGQHAAAGDDTHIDNAVNPGDAKDQERQTEN